jgi:hypothetical protein
MNLYEVIYHGAVGRDDDADTMYLVRAQNALSAIETASRYASHKDHPRKLSSLVADIVYLIGIDLAEYEHEEPLVLRGPYVQLAYNYTWRRWEPEFDPQTRQRNGRWIEIPYRSGP